MIKRLFYWVFKKELNDLEEAVQRTKAQERRLSNLLGGIDVGVDVDISDKYRARSWACISIQGKQADFIKFVDLGNAELIGIHRFLKHFESNIKIDAAPDHSRFLRFNHDRDEV
jgi:hypothetical protein